MTIKCNPNSLPSRYSALSRLQIFLAVARKAPKSILQIRWERRWTAASGAWFAVLVALLLGGIDWRAAVMVAATTFMLARSGDMLDDYDDTLRPGRKCRYWHETDMPRWPEEA